MNTVNMNSMPMTGGPVGGPMPMAGSNALAAASQVQRPPENNRANLNTYIYDYFIREHMYDCARAMLNSDQALNVHKNSPRRSDDMGDDPMDTDSKDDLDSKRPPDLPAPNVPNGGDSCFLYEWFCLFWDMLSAQRNKGGVSPNVSAYVNHTQNTVRMRQAQQAEMLRGMPYNNGMMRLPNGMPMGSKGPQSLVRTAMQNNQNNPMMLQANKNQMPRDGSNMDGNANRPASPGGAENAPSPSKRPRLDGGGPFNPQHPSMMNGQQRPQPGGQGFTNFQKENPHNQAGSIRTYAQTLQQHHGNQMPNKQGPNPAGPQGQASPSMMQGADGNTPLGNFYNAEMNPQGMRQGAGPGQTGGSNHALQDYQMQLMLLEQQNKKRLMMARQEQDSMGGMPRGDGSGPNGPGGPPGPNGQSFQDGSPQGVRPGASPNPSEQMKRGTPQMNPAGIPSPLPEGARAGGSPNAMAFMPNGMDPSIQKQFYPNMNGMENGMVPAGQMNGGMRPPSSHPNQPFNGQMNQQMLRQQGPQGGPQQQMGWTGPNGNGMAPQGPPQGNPQQRMPPPSAPAAAANTNGRTNTSSPQTSNAAPPTPQQSTKTAKKVKDTGKGKKGAAAKNKAAQAPGAGATPAADASQEPEPPTPATPITPVNPGNFKPGQNNGAVQPAAPASVAQAPPAQVAVPDSAMDFSSLGGGDGLNFGIGDFLPGNGDVLPDFDFDSFLHDNGDGGDGGFDFNPATFGMGEEQGQIGAE
ncbi:hypothetical protein GGR57DRAFT_289732 [Xylariaceae sp. FL1272]|nr:hypothetical protein GGR57DRAFT_289732 [Xylariaceae sp. FL1272]